MMRTESICSRIQYVRDIHHAFQQELDNPPVVIGLDRCLEILIRSGDPVGEIHFSNDYPRLGRDQGIFDYTRMLHQEGRKSLSSLAFLCQKNDPRLVGIDAFAGASHVVGESAKKLGFTVYNFPDNRYSAVLKTKCAIVVLGNTWRNPKWWTFAKKRIDLKIAYITRDRLVELHAKPLQRF